MSDRTPCQAIIFDCPEDKRDAVRDLLIEANLGLDFGYGAGADEPLQLGEKYGDDDSPLDANSEIGGKLIEQFPEITFEIWSDPKYEWDGAITQYAPDLGRYDGTCNSEGEVYLTARQVRDGMTAGDLDKTLGLAWLERMDELRERLNAEEKSA